MGTPQLIAPLDLAEFDPSQAFPDPGFTALASSELGDIVTGVDGFATVFDELVAFVDALEAGLAALNPTLDETFLEASSIDPGPVSDTLAGFTGDVGAGSKYVDDLGTLLSTVTTPTPPGAGPGPAVSLNFGIVEQGFAPPHKTVTLHNGGAGVVAIKSITLTQDQAGVFTYSTSCGVSLPAGASCTVTVFVHPIAEGDYNGRLTVVTDATDSPHLFDLSVTIIPPGGGVGPPAAIVPAPPGAIIPEPVVLVVVPAPAALVGPKGTPVVP